MENRERIKVIIWVYNETFNKNFKHIHEVIEAIKNEFIFDKAYRVKLLTQINDLINKQGG